MSITLLFSNSELGQISIANNYEIFQLEAQTVLEK